MKKNIKSISIIIIVIFFCVLIYVVKIGTNNKEIPNDIYIKMSEINDNETLIGLSKEEVIKLLGEPIDKFVDEHHLKNHTYYTYVAGHTFKLFLGNAYGKKYYALKVLFDENGIVKCTYIKEFT